MSSRDEVLAGVPADVPDSAYDGDGRLRMIPESVDACPTCGVSIHLVRPYGDDDWLGYVGDVIVRPCNHVHDIREVFQS